MLSSIITGRVRALIIAAVVVTGPFLYGFKAFMDEREWVNWGNRLLNESYDPSAEIKMKKWELTLTPDRFIRLRKTYQQGKQEYYSFNLQRFAAMEYLPGQGQTDTLELKTQADDIIVQTYDDPKGDVDSMATMLNIPVKKIAPERVDSLKQALNYLKAKNL